MGESGSVENDALLEVGAGRDAESSATLETFSQTDLRSILSNIPLGRLIEASLRALYHRILKGGAKLICVRSF